MEAAKLLFAGLEGEAVEDWKRAVGVVISRYWQKRHVVSGLERVGNIELSIERGAGAIAVRT